MTQQVLVKGQTRKYYQKPVQPIKGNPGSYWVQSERHNQLWYKVVLRPEQNVVSCKCDAFKFHPELACKHILKVVAIDVGGMEV